MTSLHFALYQSTGLLACQHLVLYAQDPILKSVAPALAHWTVPQLGHHQLTQQSHSLLAEATELPPTAYLVDRGTCTLMAGELPPHIGQERIRLHFEGYDLRGQFALLRLRPSGSRWLFGRLQFMPDKFERGTQVAPAWPTTQTTSV
ncbi:hypothetical protein MTX78_13220 [Hymenobacter tibetensis]|uniref:Uncharacterized protein n=1 Tax=Hymenobacter tibetensis TaxID=497967 RepID=A0ABY4CS58_9BACT|nr:hypothetical protein [Hymenobacter tibetensis]UOG73085.1 hypothetical protein MTX78_13220 [Hymenobacter tibetensis]